MTSLEVLTKSQQAEINDLKEQVRDLMFFLEAQKTVDGVDQETKDDIQVQMLVVYHLSVVYVYDYLILFGVRLDKSC